MITVTANGAKKHLETVSNTIESMNRELIDLRKENKKLQKENEKLKVKIADLPKLCKLPLGGIS